MHGASSEDDFGEATTLAVRLSPGRNQIVRSGPEVMRLRASAAFAHRLRGPPHQQDQGRKRWKRQL